MLSVNVGETFDDDMSGIVFWNLRVPRALMALSCGTLLSISGCIMQGVFRNPLAEPYTMGLSGGALVGVSVALSMGLAYVYVDVFALVGALASMLIVLVVRKVVGGSVSVMLLAGVMISFATSSLSTLLMYTSTRENVMHIISWSMGSFESVDATRAYGMMILSVVCLSLCSLLGNVLNVLYAGEDVARHVGVDSRFYVVLLFVLASVMTSVCVAGAGIIAFVGMIVPNLVRRIVGVEHRVLLPLSGIVGGAFLLACDVLARVVVYPMELPAGVFSGVLGGCVFIVILCRKWSV